MSEQFADAVDRHGPTCGCLGCTADADAVIEHTTHGRRVVCQDHVSGFEVVDYV